MTSEMERELNTNIKTRPLRDFPEDIDGIVRGYGARALVVQLWRRVDGTRNEWTYLGRLAPEQCEIELIAERFGGGWYRAKILGRWDRGRRQEDYFEQVSFGISSRRWPVTAETLARIKKQQEK
jgi:hypothetical protein